MTKRTLAAGIADGGMGSAPPDIPKFGPSRLDALTDTVGPNTPR